MLLLIECVICGARLCCPYSALVQCQHLQLILDDATDLWGVKVERVEMWVLCVCCV